MFDNTNTPATAAGQCMTFVVSDAIFLPRLTDRFYGLRFMDVSLELDAVLKSSGAPLYAAGYGLLQVYFFRELHAALASAGAQPGQVVVYDAPSRASTRHTLTAAFELLENGRYRLAAVSVLVDAPAREERVYILDMSSARVGNGEVWEVEKLSLSELDPVEQVSEAAPAEVMPVAVFAAPGGLALPSDPSFKLGKPVHDYSDFVRTSLDALGLRIHGLSSGLAHPVLTPDLARRMLDMLCETDTEVLGAAYGDQPFLLVYRPKARSGETRMCLEVELEEGDFHVVGLSVETALSDLPESLELLPPEEADPALFNDAA